MQRIGYNQVGSRAVRSGKYVVWPLLISMFHRIVNTLKNDRWHQLQKANPTDKASKENINLVAERSSEKKGQRMQWFFRLLRRCWYPAPEPLERTRMYWIALGMVTLAVVAFCSFFLLFLLTRHDALQTNAEDLGIMDQAIWTTLHGNILHQTICNIISDTNCYSPDGVMRFAIHVEPILFPISLLYALWPSPKTLLVIQTLIVASGAFPAFWLARLRLRSELAGVAIAILYLLYPAQQQATTFDFHAVTFTAAFFLFLFYFLYTRRIGWVFVFAVLAMACKEEIPLVVAVIGVWSMVFQHRWRSGGALTLLALAWFAFVYWYVIPHASPTGHALLMGRYDQVGGGPIQVLITVLTHPLGALHTYVLEPAHMFYLRLLLSPSGYISLLSPWIFIIAAPSIAINLFSSFPNMYSGLYQYGAEIVPVLIFATIEGVVVLRWLVGLFMKGIVVLRARLVVQETQSIKHSPRLSRWPDYIQQGFVILMFGGILLYTVHSQYRGEYKTMPGTPDFTWPVVTAHAKMVKPIINMIPSDASVSAQTSLVPHLSQRDEIYMFPYGDERADYILLDTTSGTYPFHGDDAYMQEVKLVMTSGNYGLLLDRDGYVLLQAGLPPPQDLPDWLDN